MPMKNIAEKMEIYNNITLEVEKTNVPFPQANSFKLLIVAMNYIGYNSVKAKDLAEHLNYNVREGKYYIDALRYLNICEKGTSVGEYILNKKGRYILSSERVNYFLVNEVLKHEPFHKAFGYYIAKGEMPSKEYLIQFISDTGENISGKTLGRRASTVFAWINWVISCEIE